MNFQTLTELRVRILFLNPLHCSVDDVQVELQLELVDLQPDNLLMEKNREENLEFNRCLPDIDIRNWRNLLLVWNRCWN